MQHPLMTWSQQNATEYEATQELLTKVFAACMRCLSQKELTNEHVIQLRTILKDAKETKRSIQPTTQDLSQIRARYRDVLVSVRAYV